MDDVMDHNMTSMPPMSSPSSSNNTMTMPHHKMMMHMTFYWGNEALVLFSGWPGDHVGMYILSLFLVFLLAVVVEWLSRAHLVSPDTNVVVSGLVLTLLHALRMGLAYLVMLAVMSFNGGIFIAALAGHAVGFMAFGTRIFGSKGSDNPDLPPMSC